MPWTRILLQGDAAVLESVNNPYPVSFSPPSPGVGATASRYDHLHSVPTPTVSMMVPVDGGPVSVGAANAWLHADHKHGLGPLTAGFNMNFSENEGIYFCLENNSATYGMVTKRLGRIYFCLDSTDRHPYVYTG
jgi:hypothetical protein